MSKNLEMSYLLDFYGEVLTEKQRDMMQQYFNMDLSLSEIADNFDITRQGVRDVIVRAEAYLTEVEDKTHLIRRFHEAKENGVERVTCWGDGSPLREFLYVDDLANLCVFLMNNYSGNETVNAGSGKELTIKALTELVAKVVGYEGVIEWDTTRPNGTPRKLLDVSKAEALGWKYKTELEEGIALAYKDFLENPVRAER